MSTVTGNNIAQDVIVHTKVNDDWTVDCGETHTFPVPNFVRLFVIKRVLTKYTKTINNNCNNNNNNNNDTSLNIDNLVSSLNSNDIKIAKDILSRLINDGIKIYMEKWYNEIEQANTIEIIFNQIILTKFEKEYSNITTYYNDNNGKSITDVFNNSDLMCLIFQFLDNDFSNHARIELFPCCFVNSHWLYQALNPHSVYQVHLTELIRKTNLHARNDFAIGNNAIARAWQRLSNAKRVHISISKNEVARKLTLNRLSILKNVEIIDGFCYNIKQFNIFKVLLNNDKNEGAKKIKKYNIHCFGYISQTGKEQLSPLRLLNATSIHINFLDFPLIWSKKCQRLVIGNTSIILSHQWCKDVINYCDCSGVTQLTINSATFFLSFKQNGTIIDRSSKLSTAELELLNKFVGKFQNLKELEMQYNWLHTSFLCFWKYFKNIINKNDTILKLSLPDGLNKEQYQELSETINYINGKIEKINFNVDSSWQTSKEIIKKMLNHVYDKLGLQWIDVTLRAGMVSEKEIEDGIQFVLKLVIGTAEDDDDNDDDHDEDDTNTSVSIRNGFNGTIKTLRFIISPYYANLNVIDQLVCLLSNAIPNLENDNGDDNVSIMNKQKRLQSNGLCISFLCGINSIVEKSSNSNYDTIKEKRKQFIAFFEKTCQSIHSWMFDYGFAVQIGLVLMNMEKNLFDKCYNDVYLKYFSQDIIAQKYQIPKRCKYYQPRNEPKLLFQFNTRRSKFKVSNMYNTVSKLLNFM